MISYKTNGCALLQRVKLVLVLDHFLIFGAGSVLMKFLHVMSAMKLV